MDEQSTATMKRTSDASVALIRRFVEALEGGDIETLGAVLADDIEWHEIGRKEPIVGKEALAARFGGALPQWDITGETHDILANDDHGIALLTATANMGGKSLTYRVAEIYHIRDGKISARWAFSDDTAVINEFFAGT
ncbi:MAG: nuclear transport factor 2 family protein [Candidatus Limnocylindria bacterium]